MFLFGSTNSFLYFRKPIPFKSDRWFYLELELLKFQTRLSNADPRYFHGV